MYIHVPTWSRVAVSWSSVAVSWSSVAVSWVPESGNRSWEADTKSTYSVIEIKDKPEKER